MKRKGRVEEGVPAAEEEERAVTEAAARAEWEERAAARVEPAAPEGGRAEPVARVPEQAAEDQEGEAVQRR